LKSILIRTLSVGIVFTSASLVPQANAQAQTWSGKASYYSGRGRTASGGHVGGHTAAHRTLPFGTKVMVTNLTNGRSTVVTINDRGPFVRGRVIDVSAGAAGVLGMRGRGVAPVRLSTL
jgi:rare lipoprotein A